MTALVEWNPVKELKELIHHMLGADNSEWNPVKELKANSFRMKSLTAIRIGGIR